MTETNNPINEGAFELERELLARGRAEQLEELGRTEMTPLKCAPAVPLFVLECDGVTRAPAWQFELDVREAVEQVLAAFGAHRSW